jgi:catechol 2,3-dioxygenase-like lactoylglutathione lyase family enzyme
MTRLDAPGFCQYRPDRHRLRACRHSLMAIATLWALLVALCPSAHAQVVEPFDHLHLVVPDVEFAREWYIQHMGGNAGETPDAVSWGAWPGDHPMPVQLLFTLADPSHAGKGTTIDHVGFSFANLDAAVDELHTAGVRILSPVSVSADLGKHAVAEDPWGTRLVLVEDPEAPGIHHVEIRVADPEASLSWYARMFGGERVRFKGTVDAVRYRGLGVFYLFATRDDQAVPGPGRTLDHLGFGPIDLDKVVRALTAEGAVFTSNPNPRLNPGCRVSAAGDERDQGVQRLFCEPPPQLAHRAVFLSAPDGVRIELVQHLEAGGH